MFENQFDRLNKTLHKVATTEQIMEALGIADAESQEEGFWTTMKFAAHLRFYLLCLKKLNYPLSTEFVSLTREHAKELAIVAESFIQTPGFCYKTVHEWFINGGSFEYQKAKELKAEQEFLEARCLHLIVILEKGAKYLGYSASGEPILVDVTESKKFPLNSMTETSKQYLLDMAKHFNNIKDMFNAREVKLLITNK